MASKPLSSVDIASNMFDIPVRRFGNFSTEQAKFVHLLRLKVNEIQRGFSREGEMFYDKMKFKEHMVKSRLRTPETYSYMTNPEQFESFWHGQNNRNEFVIKPNHLSQGRHIYVMKKDYDEYLDPTNPDDGYISRYDYVEIDGTKRTKEFFNDVAKKVLHTHVHRGLIMEETIHTHDDFKSWYRNDGIADLRAYVLYDTFLYGKLRLPSKRSHYYGNTGRDASAFFVDSTGVIQETDLMDNTGIRHPDTHISLKGEQLPFWDKIENTIISVAKLFKIPFHSVDLTVDHQGIPCVIESEKIPYLGHFTKRGAVELKRLMDDWSS